MGCKEGVGVCNERRVMGEVGDFVPGWWVWCGNDGVRGEKESVEKMSELTELVNGKGKEDDTCHVEAVDTEAVVVPRCKLSSCASVVCLLSSMSRVEKGRQTRWRRRWRCRGLCDSNVDGNAVEVGRGGGR